VEVDRIAVVLGQGAPTNTVLSWLRRARAQLHTMLKEEIEDEVV
jgi:RNA polymerase sigma-70 factor (ECF subfamily)